MDERKRKRSSYLVYLLSSKRISARRVSRGGTRKKAETIRNSSGKISRTALEKRLKKRKRDIYFVSGGKVEMEERRNGGVPCKKHWGKHRVGYGSETDGVL